MLGTYLQIHEVEPNINSIRPSFQIITYSFDALGNLIPIFITLNLDFSIQIVIGLLNIWTEHSQKMKWPCIRSARGDPNYTPRVGGMKFDHKTALKDLSLSILRVPSISSAAFNLTHLQFPVFTHQIWQYFCVPSLIFALSWFHEIFFKNEMWTHLQFPVFTHQIWQYFCELFNFLTHIFVFVAFIRRTFRTVNRISSENRWNLN